MNTRSHASSRSTYSKASFAGAFMVAMAWLPTALLPTTVLADFKVVTTTPDLAAIAQEIGGSHVDVRALALPTQDPHFVDARPNLALALARADLLIAVGLGLEVGWLPNLQTGSRNRNIQNGARGYLDCSQFVELLQVPTQRVDRSMGDVHPGGNPHYMFEPQSALRVARGITERLKELDPSHRADYDAGLRRFESALSQAVSSAEARLRSLRGKKVVTYHQSFVYLARWLGFEVVERIEPRPGIPPNPTHVARVLRIAREQNVRTIITESWYPTNIARTIATRSGARIVSVPGGPDVRAGESYTDFIGRLAELLGGSS